MGKNYQKRSRGFISVFVAMVLLFTTIFGTSFLSSSNAYAKGKVKLSKTKKTLKVGEKFKLKVKNTSKKVKWKITSGKDVIKFSSQKKKKAVIEATSEGKAKVVAKVSGKKLKCKITVKKNQTNPAQTASAGAVSQKVQIVVVTVPAVNVTPGTSANPAQTADASANPAQTADASANPDATEGADASANPDSTPTPIETPVPPTTDDYKLSQVLVFSRHSIRAPMCGEGSVLDTISPHKWHVYDSNVAELTMRGGVIETMMGQYFRKWLEDKELIPQNYQPAAGSNEVRFYANAKQRTIATSQYFSSGMLPVANVPIETNADYDTMDPVFNPGLSFYSDYYEEVVRRQIDEIFDLSNPESETAIRLQKGYDKIMEVIDFKDSEAYKNGSASEFLATDYDFSFGKDKETVPLGSINSARECSDALTLQYYEEPDAIKAAFGHNLSYEDWKLIASVKDISQEIAYTTPLLALNTSHMIMEEIQKELNTEGRKFTFLCGHDSNISGILKTLNAEFGELPETIEEVPIGTKIVFEIWEDSEENKYVSARLVYATSEQLRKVPLINYTNQPASYYLSFKEIEKNEDGLYSFEDLNNLFDVASDAYDEMVRKYEFDTSVKPDEEQAPAA